MINSELIANDLDANQAVLDEVLVDDIMAPDDIDFDDQQSQRYKQQLKNISIIKSIMTRLGWTTCASEPNTLQDSGALISHEPVSGIHIGSGWKEIIVSKR